ncbi:MAG: GNAT family N-acetyltransferase [Planctomycetota bacterium]|jgi:GNAT superfamily N-acetyltransferase
MPKRAVTITYLEMLAPGWLRAKLNPEPPLRILECVLRQPDLCKFMYQWVGRNWDWKDRLCWSDDQWGAYIADENVRMWLASVQGSIAGYFELVRQAERNIKISYFGLLPECIGKGYGGYMLTEAIRLAWEWDAKRVWVHTCTLDHEGALSNYLARGMKIYKTAAIQDDLKPDA